MTKQTKEGLFCKLHQTVTQGKKGYCIDCGTIKKVEDLYNPGEESKAVEAPKYSDAQLIGMLSTRYRNENLCPNCNPAPKEIKNNAAIASVSEIELRDMNLEACVKYFESKFKEKFVCQEVGRAAQRVVCKSRILFNLAELKRQG
jgi:hypothetical protein